MINDDLKLTGKLRIALNNEVIQETQNLVVTAGKNWVADRMNNANTVMTHMAIGTGTTTAVAASWTTISLTWDNQLPVGRYALVGGHFTSATGVAWRTIFEDQMARPGGLAVDAGNERTATMFRKGGLGIWGTFDSNRMPVFEVLCSAADTAQTLLIDFVRTG